MDSSWQKALDGFRTHLVNKYSNATTRNLYWSYPAKLASSFKGSLDEVTTEDLQRFVARRSWDTNTRVLAQRSLKHFFSFAKRVDQVGHDPAARWERIPQHEVITYAATRHDIEAAIKKADPLTTLMIELAADAGLTASEISLAHSRDLELVDGDWTLRVRTRKGKEEPLVPLPLRLGERLNDAGPGFFFPGRGRDHLESSYISRLISRSLPSGVSSRHLRLAYKESRVGRKSGRSWRDGGRYRAEGATRLTNEDLLDNKMLQVELHRIERNLERQPPQAIQNSKRILEAVFKTILFDRTGSEPQTDDLPSLWNKVSEALEINAKSVPLNLEASASIKSVMQALTRSVQSVAELRNTIGDDHGARFVSPAESRHAFLAFNAAVTVAEFAVDTWRIVRDAPKPEATI